MNLRLLGPNHPLFTSEERESLREAGDCPKAPGGTPEWGQDWFLTRASAPMAPTAHDGPQGITKAHRQLHLQGQGEVLSPQKLPSEGGQAYF